MGKSHCAGVLGGEVPAALLALPTRLPSITYWILGTYRVILLHRAERVLQHESGGTDAAVGQGVHSQGAV